jgi:general secretion pathway protein A
MANVKTAFIDEELNYLDFFGLKFNPFPVAPDDEHFYFSEHIEQIVSEIIHGIVTRKGFMVLTGDIGLGKTTISRWIMNILAKKDVDTSLVFHTTYQDVELLAEINRDFGIKAEGFAFSDQMWALNQFLLERNRAGRNCAIIIDDAQNMSHRSLELIRMISNLEAYHEKLVQILLVGQQELMEKLNSDKLRQLRSRIIISKEVHCLRAGEVANYIEFKLNCAGNQGLVGVDHKALKKLHYLTGGNFRQINTLMDRCLYAAFLDNTKEIAARTIKVAHADLNPIQQPLKARRLTGMLVAALTVLLLGGGLYTLLLRSTNSAEQATSAVAQRINVADVNAVRLSKSTTALQKPAANALAASQNDPESIQAGPVPVAVIDFLRVYGLERYADSFYRELRFNRLNDLAAIIFGQTGWVLIRLAYLPDHIRKQFDVLAFPVLADGSLFYYLFWKPNVTLPKFYYRLMGQNVYTLQEMLARAGFYQDKLDGIVGKNLMQAIIDFQEQAGLKVSGYPDEQTVFLLAHYEKRYTQ